MPSRDTEIADPFSVVHDIFVLRSIVSILEEAQLTFHTMV
jgi:hypothetical protein